MPDPVYVAISNIIGDDIVLPDGEKIIGLLGGAGTYAVAGMRIWTDRVGIVSGIGEDFEEIYGSWFKQNGIDTQGLFIRDANTPRSWITYETSDNRIETPQFGSDHFHRMEPDISNIPIAYHNARGLYIFRDTNKDFWRTVFSFQSYNKSVVIWEIHAHAATASHWSKVSDILSQVDLLSINLQEAQDLCQLSDTSQIIKKLRSTGVRGIALRLGSQGTFVADDTGIWRIPAYKVAVVDVTGAGNAFTGGFLVGYCETGGDIITAGQYGAISASFMLEQFGPPEHISPVVQEVARARLQSLTPKQIN